MHIYVYMYMHASIIYMYGKCLLHVSVCNVLYRPVDASIVNPTF